MKEKLKEIRQVCENIIYLLRLIWLYDKKFVLCLPVTCLFKACTALIVVIFPKYIIDELTQGKRISVAMTLAVSMVVVLFIVRLISNLLDTYNNKRVVYIKNSLRIELQEKITKIPYWMIEEPEVLDMYQKATGIVTMWQADLQRLVTAVYVIVTSLITLAELVYVLLSLNFLIFTIIFGVVIFNTFLSGSAIKKQLEFFQTCTPHVRKISYLMNEIQENEYAKEIRSYQIQDWLTEKSSDVLNATYKRTVRNINYQTLIQVINATTGILQTVGMYLYIGWLLWKDKIMIGDFTMYINSLQTFASSLQDVVSNFLIIQEAGMYIGELRSFLNLEENSDYELEFSPENEKSDGYVIEVENLWFKYPHSENYILKNINLRIENGEIVSVVGDNGTGKTTLVKLLLRLFPPTRGEIRINGKNIWGYPFEEYVKLISVVLQDYKMLAFKIKDNVVLSDKDISYEKMKESLIQVGLWEKIQTFPMKEDTYLTRKFDVNGIELSGGEQQKLAISHAIYRNSPIMILDEPTANLSPIAEYEIFSQFAKMLKGKTGIYISHRMSSCKLSDKIVVLKNGAICEMGNHEQLIKQDGEYAKMYHMQANLYVYEK